MYRKILHCLKVLLLLAPLPLLALEWQEQQSPCLKALGKPAEADEKQLMSCADSFGSTARLERVSSTDRKTIETGLRWLYENGDDLGSQIAREALVRLDVQLPARAPKGTAEQKAPMQAGERKRYDPPEAKAADREAAEKLKKDGIALLKKKKWKEGDALLQKALERNPRDEATLYNLACAEANLAERNQEALNHLQDLADLGTDDATGRLIKARTDADFDPMRDLADFKRITGAIRTQTVNTIGEPGEPAVENIEKLLVKLEQRKPDNADDESKPLDHPQIWFKAHAKAQVSLLADLLKHPKVELQPMVDESKSKYDVIIRWGAKVTVVDGKKTADSIGPEVVDDQVAAARKKQNKLLAQPEQGINKVNKVVSTPERTYTEAQNMGKRVGGTVDKAKGAVEKIDSLGGKLKKL